MKSIILALILMTAALYACSHRITEQSERDWKYIPANLDECFQQLDKFISDSDKIRYKEMPAYKFTLSMDQQYGTLIRNNWGLWKKSRLKTYFENFGITGPEDISKLIFQSYHRHLTGQDDEFAKNIRYYMEHLEEVKRLDSIVKRQQLDKYRIGDTVTYSLVSNGLPFKGIVNEKDTARCWLKVVLLGNGQSKWVDVWNIKQ
ncbi:hypothetical protein CLV59_107315 [Chitinophaga dinghuensis]|uniref:DUF6794 domain-containing protein n=1 Tax=Chitinophaga dinghuensis TaxID=1539050 RepID=A0A327VUB5_9BACT|nr:DUF6794 domain-containing protein [Chitinophaga dinghuensis]RAJ77548.1 hypothetical protein CLV59_107315 [Chitinophaga dinghuensis]